jgi:hypothetical protein
MEHPPEVWHIPPGTPCICVYIYIYIYTHIHGAPVWKDSLHRKNDATKFKIIQRLINIKIAKAYRTTSHEVLCVLTGIPPILTELENVTQLCHITHRKELDSLYDAPKDYRRWSHPAEAVELKNKCDDTNYTVEIYTDGSENEKGVGSGIAICI